MGIINAIRCWLLQLHIDGLQSDVAAIGHQSMIDHFNKINLEKRIVQAQRRLDGLRRAP